LVDLDMVRYISLLLFVGLALGQTTIAVFPLENNGLKDSDARILTDRLQSEFVKLGDYTVVERKKIDKVFEEQKFQMSGCVEECIIEIGNVLGAGEIVIGSVGRFGSTFTISARLVNATSGEMIRSSDFDTDGNISDLLKTGMQIIAMELSGQKPNKTRIIPFEFPTTQVYETPPDAAILPGQKSAIQSLSATAGFSNADLNTYLVQNYGQTLGGLSRTDGANVIRAFQAGSASKPDGGFNAWYSAKKSNPKVKSTLDPTGFSNAQFEELNRRTIENRKKEYIAIHPYPTTDGNRFSTVIQQANWQEKLDKIAAENEARERYNAGTATDEDLNLLKISLYNQSAYRLKYQDKRPGYADSNLAITDSANIIPNYTPYYDIQAEKSKAEKATLKKETEKELEKFKGMLDKGLITQEDYDAKKKELLGL
jgi:TolB-like protein